MKELIPFTPKGFKHPIAMISKDLDPEIIGVLEKHWNCSSSGFQDHFNVDTLQSGTKAIDF